MRIELFGEEHDLRVIHNTRREVDAWRQSDGRFLAAIHTVVETLAFVGLLYRAYWWTVVYAARDGDPLPAFDRYSLTHIFAPPIEGYSRRREYIARSLVGVLGYLEARHWYVWLLYAEQGGGITPTGLSVYMLPPAVQAIVVPVIALNVAVMLFDPLFGVLHRLHGPQ